MSDPNSIRQHGSTPENGSLQMMMVQGSIIARLDSLTSALGSLFDGTIVFLSGGVPYWYYHLIHPRYSDGAALGDLTEYQNPSDAVPSLEEHWSNSIRRVSKLWKTHQLIVGAVLAPMFPLISVSPLPKCSWAYTFAILCLVYGSITFAICVVHRVYFYNVDVSGLHTSWYTMPGNGFFDRNILRFYVSFSLPTVWFAGFVTSFALTILVIMIGVEVSHDDLDIKLSCTNNSKFLLAVVPMILVIAFISFVRSIKYALKISQGTA